MTPSISHFVPIQPRTTVPEPKMWRSHMDREKLSTNGTGSYITPITPSLVEERLDLIYVHPSHRRRPKCINNLTWHSLLLPSTTCIHHKAMTLSVSAKGEGGRNLSAQWTEELGVARSGIHATSRGGGRAVLSCDRISRAVSPSFYNARVMDEAADTSLRLETLWRPGTPLAPRRLEQSMPSSPAAELKVQKANRHKRTLNWAVDRRCPETSLGTVGVTGTSHLRRRGPARPRRS